MRCALIGLLISVPLGCKGSPSQVPPTTTPAADSVTVFEEFPPAYDVLGDVEAQAVVAKLGDELPEAIVASVKSQAADLGADGVKIETVLTTAPRGSGGTPITIIAKGKAFRIAAGATGTVTVYRRSPPGAYDVLGDVEAQAVVELSDDNLPDVLLAALRSQATKLGADGVVVESIDAPSFASTGRDGKTRTASGSSVGVPTTVRGKAIRMRTTRQSNP